MQRVLLLLFFLSITSIGFGQRIENIKAEVSGDGERVIITYDIAGASEGQKFKVSIFSSHNSFATPLSMVSGDVGRDREVPPGTGKRIEWSAKNELKDFVGDVTFEIRAEILSNLFIESPSLGRKYKKGKTLEVIWKGGAPGEDMRIDLLKGGTVVTQIASLSNTQRYVWSIPKSIDKSGDYQVRLSGNSGTALSGNFSIKPKTSFMVKALPVLAVGAVAAVVLSGGKKTTEKNLPEPPEPTN